MPAGRPRPSIARAVAQAFRDDPAYRRVLEDAKRELAEKKAKAKAKRAKGKRN